ncbi:MAG TPA: hypothetical protein VMU10_04490, partial [Desulfomonilia bacterium]|nr:hypothetical protein [Desulfomonilia bacterium]
AGYLSVLFRTDIGGERLGKAVALVSEVERCLNDVSKYLPGIKDHFGHELEHALTRTGALRLAAFFIEVIEAPLQKRDYDFFKRIALSSKTKQVIYKTISGCSDVINLGEVSTISGRDKHRLLKAHSLCVPEILMLAMASYTGKERKASGQQERDASFRAYIGSLWNYYLTTYRENEVNPLLTGDDIMDVFHMAPGPKVGVLLRQVDEARADGLITTRQDAFDYLRRIISE